MWGVQAQIKELQAALEEIRQIASGLAGPDDDAEALAEIEEITQRALIGKVDKNG